jgi:ankyrin repeat protein
VGDYPLIGDIISAGAELNAPECQRGKTVLTVAVEKGDTRAIEFLIDAGADVNASAALFY